MMLENTRPRRFVVTTLSGKRSDLSVVRSKVWDGDEPIPLSFPVRAVLEKTERGLRVRNISGRIGERIGSAAREISFDELDQRPDGIFEIPEEDLYLNVYAVGRGTGTLSVLPVALPEGIDRRKPYQSAQILVFGLLCLGVLTLQFWHPAPVPKDELIPPEFAKLLLSPTLRKRQELKKAEEKRNAPAYQVTKAFQNAAVKKTTAQLFNGKAVQALLVKSNLLSAASSQKLVSNLFKGSGVAKSLGSSGIESLQTKLVPTTTGGTASDSGHYGIAETGPKVTGQGKTLLSVTPKAMEIEEGLTREEVGKVVRAHLGEIRYCYESAIVRTPTLEGKLVVSFEILAGGVVDKPQTKQSSGDATLDECILEHLSKWRFPSPRGKESVHVSYPFIFKVLGG